MKYLGEQGRDLQKKMREKGGKKFKPGFCLEEKASQLLRDSWLSWNSGPASDLLLPCGCGEIMGQTSTHVIAET